MKVNIGDKVLLKGKFFYPYDNWACDNMIGIIISKENDCGNKFWSIIFNRPVVVYKINIQQLQNYNLQIRPKNIKEILTLTHQRKEKLKKLNKI